MLARRGLSEFEPICLKRLKVVMLMALGWPLFGDRIGMGDVCPREPASTPVGMAIPSRSLAFAMH